MFRARRAAQDTSRMVCQHFGVQISGLYRSRCRVQLLLRTRDAGSTIVTLKSLTTGDVIAYRAMFCRRPRLTGPPRPRDCAEWRTFARGLTNAWVRLLISVS